MRLVISLSRKNIQNSHRTFCYFSPFYAILCRIFQVKTRRKVRSIFKVIFYARAISS
ncbi:hypothetical protein CF65_01092 [Aggregatibacter actinomycetemcomitans HK1651]|nr:hypothetical protein ANH9381_0924 [Aggregatibacter actinomycetemcomitans ANH9381]AHN71527.1 hypothetical protein CF65_01092 [Aggregatibacter actinomycetemcomitans HK1651]